MRRLIDPIELKRSIAVSNIIGDGKTLEELIDEQPDAQPQRMRGRWKRFPSDSELYKCSACYAWGEKAYKFCPWCGAEMEAPE